MTNQEAINELRKGMDISKGIEYRAYLMAISALEQEPKTGHWIAQDIHNCHTDFKCSECDYIHNFTHLYGKPTADYTYCPNCGAKMEKSNESEG